MSQTSGEFDCGPFEAILIAPRVQQAALALAGTRFATLLSPECQTSCLNALEHELRGHSRDVLETLVHARLARRNPLWELDARLAPSAETEQARHEVAEELEASGEALIDETAPLLQQVLDRQVVRFAAFMSETCERIWNDRHEIASSLLAGGIDGDIGMVADIDASLADRHSGGRRTCIVASEAGRFVYKPHDCRISQWFAHVAETFLPGALRQPRVIVRSDASGAWGFEEFMSAEPLTSEAGEARYWRNMGRALALFQALASEDMHCGNFIACGEHPSLIDTETVITGDPAHIGNPETSPNLRFASKGFGRDLDGTLVKSGALPGSLGEAGNASPLFAHGMSCLPRWRGVEYDLGGYEDELYTGLDEGLAELASQTVALSRAVRAAYDIPVRRLIRGTNVYAKLLARLQKTDAYDPQNRGNLLEVLHRPLVRGLDTTVSPLAASEIASLLDGDVPYFFATAGSRVITGSDGTADSRLLNASAVELALSHIAALDEPHRAFVRAVTEASISRALLPSDGADPACSPSKEPLEQKAALHEAEHVFQLLDKQAICSPSGETSWLFRSLNDGALSDTNVFLSNGLSGVAVFLAALAPRADNSETRERAITHLEGCLDRLDEVIMCLEGARVIPEHSASLGLADGLGGMVCALDFVDHALHGDDRLGALRERASELTGRLIAVLERCDVEHARHVDVYTGSAGLLLALALRAKTRGQGAVPEVASRLARHLVDARTLETSSGHLVWDTLGTGWPVSGFGHGQAGIGAALAAAADAFGIDVGNSAHDAYAWELFVYDERLGTWPDFRESPVTSASVHGICSGAPGLGLAAQMARRLASDDRIREQADTIIGLADRACATLEPNLRDTLCCGNLSVSEYLVSRSNMRDAGRLLAGVLERSQASGHYAFSATGWRHVDDPSLFNGLAGMGYVLLRYADPSLPSVLA